MPTSVKVKDLKINTLTEAQYDAAVQSGVIGENEISVLTDAKITAKDVHAVPQYSEMPEATSLNVDEIAQYTGATATTVISTVTDSEFSPDNPTVTLDYTVLSTAGVVLGGSGTLEVSYEVNEETGGAIAVITHGEDFVSSAEFATPEEAYASVGVTFSELTQYAVINYTAETYTNGFFYKCVSDGQTLATYSWEQVDVQPSSGGVDVNTTVTLAAANWSSNTQTVSVTGMTATGIVFVSPDPSDQADYTNAGILCTAQAAGTLTFTCDTTPSNDIDVVVVMM